MPTDGKKPRQRGRLVWCKDGGVARRPYQPFMVTGLRTQLNGAPVLDYAGHIARARCALGDHYLAPDPNDETRVVERTETSDTPAYLWPDYGAAVAAIEQLARQQEESAPADGGTFA